MGLKPDDTNSKKFDLFPLRWKFRFKASLLRLRAFILVKTVESDLILDMPYL